MIDWDKEFREADLTSWPFGTAGLTISKIKPNHETGRSIWDDDKLEIMKAAQKYNFRVVLDTRTVVSFSHGNRTSA